MKKIFTVTFPDIGEGVVEGEVIEWRKNVGDTLQQDEAVVVVMTDKATVELPSPHPGVLTKQYFEPGGTAIKDKPLYDITLNEEAEDGENSEDTPTQKNEKIALPTHKNIKKAEATSKETEAKVYLKGNEGLIALPKVRKLAKQLGIPLDEVRGSGKEGRITQEDLSRHHIHGPQGEGSLSAPWHLAGDSELPLIGIKALMAKKMVQSKATIPHFSYFDRADATRLVQLKKNISGRANEEGLHLTYMPFFLRAISLTILKHPLLNSSFDAENFKVILHKKQNIGIAMATPLGLIVPVLKEVENMNLCDIIHAYEALIERATTNKLLPSDMKEATFTISNYGASEKNGLFATPIINTPESAILGISRIHKEPLVKNGTIAICDVVNLSWSFDHRINDGNSVSQILKTLSRFIENPATLL